MLYRYEVLHDRVLDLTVRDTRRHLDVAVARLVESRLDLTRQIGQAAHEAGFEAVRSPSATGARLVLAVFTERLEADCLTPEFAELSHRPPRG